MRQEIKNFSGIILGTLEDTGNKIIARSFSGIILGTYDKGTNQTKDFSNKIISYGNTLSYLIVKASGKEL